MSNPLGCKTQLYKRHVLADSGINLIHPRTIAVERFAVLDFHRSLPSARLHCTTKSGLAPLLSIQASALLAIQRDNRSTRLSSKGPCISAIPYAALYLLLLAAILLGS
jgi:hypothetical protein